MSHELGCYSNSQQEPTGEARIDEQASLVVSLAVPDDSPIPLRGIIDTGLANQKWLSFVFNRVDLQTCVALQSHRIDLYAANGTTIKFFRIADRVGFQLDGYQLRPLL